MNRLDSPADKVRKWAEFKHLNKRSIQCLLDLGFECMDAIAFLGPEDLVDSDMPIGQTKLLLRTVAQTFMKSPGAAVYESKTRPVHVTPSSTPADAAMQSRQ